MKKQLLYLLAVTAVAASVLMISCQKELSFEGANTPAKGSLQSDVTGDCLPKTVNGIYAAGTALIPVSNTITVQVNVTQTGTFVVTTDTVNGYFFRGTGTFTTLGPTVVTLRGNGTPFAQGTNNFVVSFDGTVCDIAVTVLPAGSGAAVFTMTCGSSTVNGTYTSGTALTAANTITIPITLTTPGSYTLSGNIDGMTFANSGALTVGTTTITLNGTGTPATSGTFSLIVGSCTIPITVTAGAGVAVYTMNCGSATVNGTYTAGTILTGANTITIPITLTTPGTYNITTAPAVNGMIFSNSGTLPAGTTSITLNGSGTPTAAGTFNFTAGSCTIPVTVAAGGGAAVYTLNCAGATVNGTYTAGTILTAANTITIPITLTTPGTYSITTAPAVNGMIFSNSGTLPAGTTSITLNGSGTPTAAGTFNFTVGSCTIPVTVTAAPVVDWSFKIGTTTYSGFSSTVPGETSLDVLAPGIYDLYYQGYDAANDDFYVEIIDNTGGAINANENYISTNQSSNLFGFYYTDAGNTIDLIADPTITTAGVTMTFHIVSHNTATKTVIATFTGTAFDNVSGTIKTITNGNVKIVYP